MAKKWFESGYRRLLVDMHIPDFDEKFLAKVDPAEMVRLYKRAGLSTVMFYAQSHVGLCYWPTKTGKMHAGLRGRDIVGEMLALLRKAKLDAVVYYSVIYNNWAYLNHPEWRLVPATAQAGQTNGGRYGRCCPNHPEYRRFVVSQIEELLGAYRYDGVFYDMTFWPRVCVCEHCRARLRKEAGIEIPITIDWCSKDWCAFQAARERWMLEFIDLLAETSGRVAPGIAFYHNFASSKSNWVPGLAFASAERNDILGADFYGDPVEQLAVCKSMTNLARNKPVEFMTSRCVHLYEHEHNKAEEMIRMQSLAATLFSAATFFIDAIAPDGTMNAATYDILRRVYAEAKRFEPFLGGQAVEDVGVYYSNDSKMDFEENGKPLSEGAVWQRIYPHLAAVRGLVRVLQQAHVPFGVITRRQIGVLARYKAVALPNVLRMDAEEVEAIREYVRGGGQLYASRLTSLTETCGVRHKDFLLADVFGCHFAADDLGNVTYLKAATPRMAKLIQPQRYLSHLFLRDPGVLPMGTVRLADRAEGQALATLTLPYGDTWGTVYDKNWSSIHSSPPWRDLKTPALVANPFGKGRCVYSAADIECKDGEANSRVLLGILLGVLGVRPSATADAHPCVWMSVTDQPDKNRLLVGLLNYPSQLPAIPIAEVPFAARPPKGKRFTRLRAVPSLKAVPFQTGPGGLLRATAKHLKALSMYVAEYA